MAMQMANGKMKVPATPAATATATPSAAPAATSPALSILIVLTFYDCLAAFFTFFQVIPVLFSLSVHILHVQ